MSQNRSLPIQLGNIQSKSSDFTKSQVPPTAQYHSDDSPLAAMSGIGSVDDASLITPVNGVSLIAAYRQIMQSGMHGLCFSPYIDGQGPGTAIEANQIRLRMEMVSPHTKWIRSFSCTEGNQLIPQIAHACGLKTLVGAWLGTDRSINEQEIEAVIALARAGHADLVAIGNEVLLREDMAEDELLSYIQRVKQALPSIQVGYVDAYYLFEKHPKITAACDVIMANCYPFWEGCALDHSIAYMQDMYKRTIAVASGKKVIISETGWPNKGTAFHGAVPSQSAAMRYFVDSMNWSTQDNIDIFYFSAFDEAWKVGAEGDVGAYWGLWDKNGLAKYS